MSDAFDWDQFVAEEHTSASAPAPTPAKTTVLSDSSVVESWVADLIMCHDLDRPRSRQTAVGPSSVGNQCDRALAYMMSDTEAVNYPDPLKAYIGTGAHLMLEDAAELRDSGIGRYLREVQISYRGITGNVDLFDRVTGRVIDWKSKDLAKIKRLRRQKTSKQYEIQRQIYAAGLAAAGENVKSVALVYIPVNGLLSDIYVDEVPFDQSIADEAIDRIEALQNRLYDSVPPQEFPAKASALCPWCPFYNPNAPLSQSSCPGGAAKVAVDDGDT